MRRKLSILGIVGIFFLLVSSEGGANAPLLEENCPKCSEQELNAALGPDELAPLSFYDDDPANPPRNELKFPPFDATWGLKQSIYDKAVAFYEQNREDIPNPRYATLIDFSRHSSTKRLFLFDLFKGTVDKHLTSHGKNSDPDNDGRATRFSNVVNTLMSSLGFYYTLATYEGNHGYSLRLQGLESTNSNAEARAIVMHPAEYISEANGHAGRSWGCPAVDPVFSTSIIDRVKNGSLLLIDR